MIRQLVLIAAASSSWLMAHGIFILDRQTRVIAHKSENRILIKRSLQHWDATPESRDLSFGDRGFLAIDIDIKANERIDLHDLVAGRDHYYLAITRINVAPVRMAYYPLDLMILAVDRTGRLVQQFGRDGVKIFAMKRGYPDVGSFRLVVDHEYIHVLSHVIEPHAARQIDRDYDVIHRLSVNDGDYVDKLDLRTLPFRSDMLLRIRREEKDTYSLYTYDTAPDDEEEQSVLVGRFSDPQSFKLRGATSEERQENLILDQLEEFHGKIMTQANASQCESSLIVDLKNVQIRF